MCANVYDSVSSLEQLIFFKVNLQKKCTEKLKKNCMRLCSSIREHVALNNKKKSVALRVMREKVNTFSIDSRRLGIINQLYHLQHANLWNVIEHFKNGL